jgi:histidine triad (HIT) family protein
LVPNGQRNGREDYGSLPSRFCLYARGRRIPHTHIFLVPTCGGDPLDRFFNALEGFQEAPSEWHALKQPDRLRATAERLRKSGSSGWVEKIKG